MLTILTALLVLAAPSAAVGVDRTISNVARLTWEQDGRTGERRSNQVDIEVGDPGRIPVDTLQVAGGTDVAAWLTGSCRSNGGSGSADALPVTDLAPTRQVIAGQPFVLALDRPARNLSATEIDRFEVTVTTDTGDRESVQLSETDPDSGRFVGIILTGLQPMPAVAGDCRLSVRPQATLSFTLSDEGQPPFASGGIDILIDPYGMAFDSRDGAAVSGVRVTLIDVATGRPAQVFGDDGFSAYPATVITGQPVTDGDGTAYTFPPGDYRFPLVRPGTYRLLVEPPAPYSFPSNASPTDLAGLRRPDGEPFTIAGGSFGGPITLSSPAPVRIDIPLDRSVAPLVLTKVASREQAEEGEVVQYRITLRNPDPRHASGPVTIRDDIPEQMRFRPGSARIDGARVGDPDFESGRQLVFSLPALAPQGTAILTYLLEVRPGARTGDAVNRAQAADARGNLSNIADALVHIRRERIADRLTVIGRVTQGGCEAKTGSKGVPGIRVMLEDGSYAVTDIEGRYHFEGLPSGTHVVQLDRATLGSRWEAVDCDDNVRSAGSAFSRFVEGRGGMLKRVDFSLRPTVQAPAATPPASPRPVALSDAEAAGDRDWLTGQAPGLEWLFPLATHNPRAPITRVVIKHAPGQTVRLFADGKPVEPIAFEGTRKSDSGVAVSQWRGVPLTGRTTVLRAEVLSGEGKVVERLKRRVTYSDVTARAELLPAQSRLVADGVQRPVLALRLTDKDGRPVHHGTAGEFELPEPYYPAVEADAQQARQLAGLERARPTWRVEGDDGMAFVELEPTTASGTVVMRFSFRDGEHQREQRLQAWLSPGARPWTIVGLAEGTIGFNRLDANMEKLAGGKDDVVTDGRLALYAKGRVHGRWLLTLAYGSAKGREESRFGGVIDPDAYYTIYADRSERRYDAASVRKLYLRLERPQFYAMFGDYETGLDEPELARYVRAMNGVKAEFGSERLSAVAFAADTPFTHRRDEVQGNGLSGPYRLRTGRILVNSERVVIEVRDRLRSNRILQRQLLTRHIDYDIDYRVGTLLFREPILSRSSTLDPQFIVVDYEVDGVARRELNAGARLAWRSSDRKLQVAGTLIHDDDGENRTDLGGIDVRYAPTPATEIRAEVAASQRADEGARSAWLVEAEHHDGQLDLLAYARQQSRSFGVGQLNAAETGTRKIGTDARVRLSERLSASASAWHESWLGSDARRIAARTLLEYRAGDFTARAGATLARDRLGDGRSVSSTNLQFGATRRFFGNRLELDAQTELPLGGEDDSIDFPARHRLDGRFAVTRDVALVGTYEIANGDELDARTTRLGFDLAPWAGARIALSGNVQDIAEYGQRSFAAYGLSQSLVLSSSWSLDLSLDGNRTIGGIDGSRVLEPAHPVASGGFVGGGSLTEDFTAVTAGATYRAGRWSATGRAEYRAGEREDRYGLTFGALRQIGEGRAVGGALNWFLSWAYGGAEAEVMSGRLSWAYRPAGSALTFLNKLEIRQDVVSGAVAGTSAPFGVPLAMEGDARSRRVTNSLALNYLSHGDRLEASLFWGARYASERFGEDDVKGLSNVLGADLRFDLSSHLEVGAAASVRHSLGGDAIAWSVGPQIGLRPFANGWLAFGWNVLGYHDRDFADECYTRSGPYVTIRLKVDELSLAGLGLGR